MQKTFKTPFCRDYWQLSFSEFKNLRVLVLAALFIALRIAIKSMKIPIADNVSVFFTFTVNALGSFIYGPVLGFLSGCVCDTLSFIIAPSGPYNPAFMLVEGLGSLIFALFLYRAKVSMVRLFLSKLTVNVVCNLLLTPFFLATMYGGKTMLAHMATRLPKNLILLPIETAILIVLFAAVLPVIKRIRVLPWQKDTGLAVGILGY